MKEKKNEKFLYNVIQRDDVFDKQEIKKQILHFSPPSIKVINFYDFIIDLFDAIAPEMRGLRDSGFPWGERGMHLFCIVVE